MEATQGRGRSSHRPGCGGGIGGRVGIALCVLVFLGVGGLAAGGPDPGTLGRVTVVDRPSTRSETISLDVENTPIRSIVDAIINQTGHNILVDKDVSCTVTQKLTDVHWQRALEIVLRDSGCYLEEEGPNIWRISKPERITAWAEKEDINITLKNLATLGGKGGSIVIAPDVKGAVTYNFKDIPWKEALDTVVKSAGYVAVRERGIIRIISPAALKEQMETRIFQLKYIQPPSIYTAKIETRYAEGAPKAVAVDEATGVPKEFMLYHALKKALSDHGRLEYDGVSNAFIVTDTTPVLDQIQTIIERIDVEPLQVFVDVRFVTTSRDDDLGLGVDWEKGLTATLTPGSMFTRIPFSRDKDGGPIERTFGLESRGFNEVDIATNLAGKSPFAFGTLSFSQATAVLKVLKNDESTRVRQAPRLMVLNHQAGTVFVGSTVRYAEIFSSSNQAGGVVAGVREAENSPVNTGFQLLVVPHIVPGTKDILMTVIPESNSLTEFKEFGSGANVIQLPQIDSSTVVTQMLVRDGETAVIGGLVVDRTEEQVRKVPFLGDIPLLGYVFKWKSKSCSQDHLMIFVTPRIVRSSKDSRSVLVDHKKYDWPTETCKDVSAGTPKAVCPPTGDPVPAVTSRPVTP